MLLVVCCNFVCHTQLDGCYDGLNWCVQFSKEEMTMYLLRNVYTGQNADLINKQMDYDGKNAIHRATKLSILQMLYEIGKANPNIPDKNGLYLIHQNVSNRYVWLNFDLQGYMHGVRR